ncbi:iron(III) transport system ATP-binding protein [Bacillus sp. 491mf]|uniref:ABC transporter ATP-binding protein n=1 Tax=Bacillus sp. 491mf TaxID=1761755 RepID=UPI0008EFF7C6|nr:ABC transporter ATP-binding protein [Bacillus sp. 491mf]SFC69852.1 iron(III) transport system ATP-binding protein [Bacillus sp. 491mf]
MDICIRGLEKTYGTTQVLKPLDIVMKHGQFTTLLGPSGCGKTTLLRMIAGLEEPDGGEIYFGDKCVYSSFQKVKISPHKRRIGMVFQDFALWPHMTVFENVAFGLRASKQTERLQENVMDAIKRVRLEGLEKRYPHELSGGQQQRVAFARAIVTKPHFILFDEPLSALDAILREEMRWELMDIVQSIGLTALYVTHDQTEAMSMSNQVIVMKQGEVLQKGRPEEIYERPSHEFVAQFVGKTNWLVKNKQMIRPEHISWTKSDVCQSYLGQIKHVTYLGGHYEVKVDMGHLGIWTAYHNTKLSIGKAVSLYVPLNRIHTIGGETHETSQLA